MSEALRLTESWPVEHVAAAAIGPDGTVSTIGDQHHVFRLASIAKVIATWAVLVAVEEGTVSLEEPIGQPGCTLRHLLSHAGGYPMDGDPISAPERRRIYSNTGIELATEAIAAASAMPFEQYQREAVLEPLGMSATTLHGSPAHQLFSTLHDVVAFTQELRAPRLVDETTAAEAMTVQFPTLDGVVPSVGTFRPCPWGLGGEIKGTKSPHWSGTRTSPATFCHFGGAGTFLWVDPVPRIAAIALTDRPFDEWSTEALAAWSELGDAIHDELTDDTPP